MSEILVRAEDVMEILIGTVIVLLLAVVILQILLWRRPPAVDLTPLLARLEGAERAQERTERGLREEISRNRDEGARDGRDSRQEMQNAFSLLNHSLREEMGGMSSAQRAQLEIFGNQLADLTRGVDERLAGMRSENADRLKGFNDSMTSALGGAAANQSTELARVRDAVEARVSAIQEESSARLNQIRLELLGISEGARNDVNGSLKAFNDSLVKTLTDVSAVQSSQLSRLTEVTGQKLDGVRLAVDERLKTLQSENAAKLEQIRQTVDEELHGALEKRLGESFKLVSERLDQVHRGLGEMQNLASGVGDLKKVLTNVRARGTWAEIQLGILLDQMLTPDQYGKNVATTGTAERVEFAIKLPGASPDSCVWLPIDAKFPKEDYERLLAAVERADSAAVEECSRQLEIRIRQEAKSIFTKYVQPPLTTDFAIMYLPTEGLYAEVLRRPGLMEALQREHRVTVAGPMTLAAILNSLQMGFRTLAIQRRSSEVWDVLGAVKTEFRKYADVLEKVQKKLTDAHNTVDDGLRRTRVLERKLKNVQEVPALPSEPLVDIDEAANLELVPAGKDS